LLNGCVIHHLAHTLNTHNSFPLILRLLGLFEDCYLWGIILLACVVIQCDQLYIFVDNSYRSNVIIISISIHQGPMKGINMRNRGPKRPPVSCLHSFTYSKRGDQTGMETWNSVGIFSQVQLSPKCFVSFCFRNVRLVTMVWTDHLIFPLLGSIATGPAEVEG
jgi:hypothetical protein